jgi:hypothetical protein
MRSPVTVEDLDTVVLPPGLAAERSLERWCVTSGAALLCLDRW